MGEITQPEAIERARVATGVGASIPARTWRVRRLDTPGDSYYLVVLGEEDAAVGVATIGLRKGDVQGSARLPGTGPHSILEANEAATLAAGTEGAQIEMVWKPCPASRSPYYPLWEVRTALKVVYVDQQGRIWPDLRQFGSGG
jgi:hypothetical protein